MTGIHCNGNLSAKENMKTRILFSVYAFLFITVSGCQHRMRHITGLDPVIESKIDALLSRMTLEEKVGQLSQRSRRGEDGPRDVEEEIRNGRVGSFLNLHDLAERNRFQRIAVRESPK